MNKIMLVLDNSEDEAFLEKVMGRLGYEVISMKKGQDLSTQLIDHFPDVVFAATLGRNELILNALGKIKKVRGKPKLVYVRQQGEGGGGLTENQRKIIDGVIYAPIDPFKLLEVLSNTTGHSLQELRMKYNGMLDVEKGRKVSKPQESNTGGIELTSKAKKESNNIKVEGKVSQNQGSQMIANSQGDKAPQVHVTGVSEEEQQSSVSGSLDSEPDSQQTVSFDATDRKPQSEKVESKTAAKEPAPTEVKSQAWRQAPPVEPVKRDAELINDPQRKSKYDSIVKDLKEKNPAPTPVDVQRLRALQSQQSKEIEEPKPVKENRKHFLKTLFSMTPAKGKKSS